MVLALLESDGACLELAVEVREYPGMPTAIRSLPLMSGSAHCDLLSVEFRKCPLRLKLAVEVRSVSAGGAHCDLEQLAVEGR